MKLLLTLFFSPHRILLFFVLISFTLRLSGQSVSIGLSYSNKFYDNSFYRQLPSRNNVAPFAAPHWIGVQVVECWPHGVRGQMVSLVTMEQMLPYRIIINDSIKARMTGFNLGIPLFGMDLLKSKNVDFLIVGGVNVGRVNLGGDNRVRAKNPFISPKLLVAPRICLGKIVISGMVEYSYDVSGKQWKNRMFGAKHTSAIQPFNQNGFTLGVGAGIKVY